MINIADKSISEIYMGETPVSEVYLGEVKVWPDAVYSLDPASLTFDDKITLIFIHILEDGVSNPDIPWGSYTATVDDTTNFIVEKAGSTLYNLEVRTLTANTSDSPRHATLTVVIGGQTLTCPITQKPTEAAATTDATITVDVDEIPWQISNKFTVNATATAAPNIIRSGVKTAVVSPKYTWSTQTTITGTAEAGSAFNKYKFNATGWQQTETRKLVFKAELSGDNLTTPITITSKEVVQKGDKIKRNIFNSSSSDGMIVLKDIRFANLNTRADACAVTGYIDKGNSADTVCNMSLLVVSDMHGSTKTVGLWARGTVDLTHNVLASVYSGSITLDGSIGWRYFQNTSTTTTTGQDQTWTVKYGNVVSSVTCNNVSFPSTGIGAQQPVKFTMSVDAPVYILLSQEETAGQEITEFNFTDQQGAFGNLLVLTARETTFYVNRLTASAINRKVGIFSNNTKGEIVKVGSFTVTG